MGSLAPLPLSGVEEKMFSLLKRAKVQLFKIDQQQQQQKVATSTPVSMGLGHAATTQPPSLNSLLPLSFLFP